MKPYTSCSSNKDKQLTPIHYSLSTGTITDAITVLNIRLSTSIKRSND